MRSLTVLRAAPLYTFSEYELDQYLTWLTQEPLTLTKRVALLARQSVGQPYRLHLLGEFPFELHDADPLYCLGASDCVTFVEQTYALALAHDWPSFFRTLLRIRYRNGAVGVAPRNHFVEADWNVNNAWLFEEVTGVLAGDAAMPMRCRIDRAALLAKFGVRCPAPVQVAEGTYLPRDHLISVLDHLRDGDVVEFVRGDGQWQWVGHMGLALRGSDGSVMLVHSTRPAVREEPLQRYLDQHPAVLGVRIFRPLLNENG